MTNLAVIEPEKKEEKFMDDPLVSMIVPIYDIKPDVLKRCLLSLKDQDYGNMEVICVLDGPNAELDHVAAGFVTGSPGKFTLMEIPHGGACAARNAGFEASKGDIVSFFNSDYVAKPGMLRMWVDALQEHPDCGFVYGGYEYNASRRWIYPSKPFDAWVLSQANYIDCGFPLWRKYAVKWDTAVKSLQDWDFWIRVVRGDGNFRYDHDPLCQNEKDCIHKKPVKGFYLGRDYSFIAEMPRAKGLSEDSSNNWIDRVTFIKEKNGIAMSDILVTSLGAANHGIEIAKMIGADFRDDTFDKPSAYKALYMIGFYIKPNEAGLNEHARRLAVFKDKYPTAKRVVHFVGADIFWLRKFPWDSLKYLAGALRQSCDTILSENQAAHDELESFGIPSGIVPIPSYTDNWQVKPLPETFKVALYLVDGSLSDFDKYCFEQTLSIVRGMPDVQFTGYGQAGQDLRYPNLKHAGFIPRDKWPAYVYENSALLRIVRHDTMPMAGNEFMMAGRSVITNIKNEGTHYIDTSGKEEISSWDQFGEGLNAHRWPETKAEIMRIIRAVKNSGQTETGSDRLKDLLDKQTYIAKIKEVCHVA